MFISSSYNNSLYTRILSVPMNGLGLSVAGSSPCKMTCSILNKTGCHEASSYNDQKLFPCSYPHRVRTSSQPDSQRRGRVHGSRTSSKKWLISRGKLVRDRQNARFFVIWRKKCLPSHPYRINLYMNHLTSTPVFWTTTLRPTPTPSTVLLQICHTEIISHACKEPQQWYGASLQHFLVHRFSEYYEIDFSKASEVLR